ncbi:hypothetical protein SEA_KRADAL_227 [Streptomyces phage Kradal]|nr:hypothetical protein SEA_KRADAL_227 [Streptomyces phage Kradal]QPL14534.1 hypothetical protein SEA_EHYELIMAYOE_229 [Streptomyces phage EhyElimayoE]
MNERQIWTGIAPSPKVLARLDYEEMATLALLSWSTAANRPVTSADVAELEDRDGKKLGLDEARDIVKTLGDLKIVSVYGMGNERPMSVRVGGFQPRTPRRFMDDRRPAAPRAAVSPPRRTAPARGPQAKKGTPPWVLKDRRVETGLEVTAQTPAYVLPEAARLREMQVKVEGGDFTGTLVEAASARLAVLQGRIALYERWLKDEPRHANLVSVLAKKRKAVPELIFQVERAKVKQAELEAEAS